MIGEITPSMATVLVFKIGLHPFAEIKLFYMYVSRSLSQWHASIKWHQFASHFTSSKAPELSIAISIISIRRVKVISEAGTV